MSKVQKLTVSAMVMALYVVVLYFTQSFSFGAYQIRIATALYALAYLFPFLVLPLGFANFIANFLFGGLGLLDWFGGCFVGIIVTAIIVLIRRKGWSRWLMILPIILVPGLGVPSYLSYLLHVPYSVLATSLCIGQSVPAVCGVVLVNVLQRALYPKATKAS
ncbi:QueT transporter family protein [Agathobaculum butyriciproducens]|nr:QueT transporter family protein [Agathobaculum butyriciproducens]RHO17178.1 QueT transporter family protein [Butyricicoccus sp. AM18-35]RHO65336.1 QueT transporter family protein [Butyricicoccus sp. AM05-1]RHP16750.1 QueT transporter family protein [Butyricicoccus sp. AF35-5AC]RHS36866.1 QueT transporter family protein [Butyricicoccus sp. AF10-3]RHT73723.1 QueT transporter family protein [Butyricicoccus sp. AM28-25]RHU21032.1 QueT transporter family protein [Butyricicoccus sp. TM10-16AC]R